MTSLAVDVGQMKAIAIGVIVALLVLAVLIGILVRAVVTKAIALVVVVVFGALVWTQRASLDDCATQRDCTFFGYHLSLD
ncbi:MAG TPA: hypothetical protein VFX70_12820 [Mycobacteriales bacterium]|nr:hypothetical protein [Mycobacteriales bacterium]